MIILAYPLASKFTFEYTNFVVLFTFAVFCPKVALNKITFIHRREPTLHQTCLLTNLSIFGLDGFQSLLFLIGSKNSIFCQNISAALDQSHIIALFTI